MNIVCALRHELSEYSRRLALIHEQLDFLTGWLRGEAQLHSLTASAGDSQIHANSLLGGRLSAVLEALASDRVPPEWIDAADAEDKSAASVDDWLQSLAQSCSFFEIWLSLIVFWQSNQTVWPGLSIAGATHSQLHLVSLPLPSVFYLPAFRNPLRLLRCFSSPSSATLMFDVSVNSSTPATATPQQPQAQSTGQPELPSTSTGKAARLSVMELINLAFVRSIPGTASAQMPSLIAARGLYVFGLRLAGLSGTGLRFSEGLLLQSSDAGSTETVPGACARRHVWGDGTCPDLLPPLRLDASVSTSADSRIDASKEKATSAEGQAVSTSTSLFSCPLLRSHSTQLLASLRIPIASNSPALTAIHVLC